MKVFLSIAWRNVMRNKKRSFITAFAITIGLASLIFLWGFIDGMYPMMINNMTSMFMGHMELSDPRYVDKHVLDYAVVDGTEILSDIADHPEVESYSPRLTTFGLATYGENSQGTAIIGVDPELESKLGMLDEFIEEGGTFLENSSTYGVVVGKTLAKNIDAGLGDEILLVTANRFNNLSYLGPLPIIGILNSSVAEMDGSTVLMSRKLLVEEIFVDESIEYSNEEARITDMDGVFTSVAIRVNDMDTLEEIRAQMRETLPQHVDLRTWSEISPWVLQTLEMRMGFTYIILVIVMIIVVAGILNTVLMSVMERTREFGIMRALGTKGRQIFMTVSIESILLGLLGLIMGATLGIGLTLLFGEIGINLYGSMDTEMLGQFYIFDDHLYPLLNLEHLFTTCFSILLAVIIVSIYPARKAAKMEPVSAIKTLG